ncbi:histone-binding protein N1/N2-like isoform X2 [Dendronephthya gigantea]|uniref:histone-binding protein N1/N2-like isoform X2 n=1 Tax=Dendronephthya gigantea TaxID=151771 RepID=UPI00106AC8EF|nr:histone-binding protein N1/N2-like isoform X2 [Dendronephthya gigantea]
MASVEDEQPTSSSCTFSKEEVSKLMSKGKRHFVCDEIVEAAKCFEVACLMLSKKYGALSNECSDAHFQYGKSLLELARLENGVLGSALNEAVEEELPDSDDDMADTEADNTEKINEEKPEKGCTEEKMEDNETETKLAGDDNKDSKNDEAEKIVEKPADALKTEDNAEGKTDQDDKMQPDENKNSIKEESQENDNKDVSQDKNISNKERMNDEQKEGDEVDITTNEDQGKVEDDKETADDGPVSTIQLAWESLELARIIFKRHNSKEMQLKLAQAHLLLGEIHMEQEQFTDAVTELTKCLNIQKNLLEPDDRLLAETYYNLGLAYTLSMMYEESASHYGNAAEVLQLRLKNIKNRIEEAEKKDKGKGKSSDDDPLVKDRKELAEIEDLLPEVLEKSRDAMNEKERMKSNIKEQMGLTSSSMGLTSSSMGTGENKSACSSSSCSDKPVNVINHLVRKKAKI